MKYLEITQVYKMVWNDRIYHFQRHKKMTEFICYWGMQIDETVTLTDVLA